MKLEVLLIELSEKDSGFEIVGLIGILLAMFSIGYSMYSYRKSTKQLERVGKRIIRDNDFNSLMLKVEVTKSLRQTYKVLFNTWEMSLDMEKFKKGLTPELREKWIEAFSNLDCLEKRLKELNIPSPDSMNYEIAGTNFSNDLTDEEMKPQSDLLMKFGELMTKQIQEQIRLMDVVHEATLTSK